MKCLYCAKTFKVEISYATKILMKTITNILRGQKIENYQEVIQVVDITQGNMLPRDACLCATPISTMIQNKKNHFLCLHAFAGESIKARGNEAARALDDAVAVARRRSHAQKTSLHAVSPYLALPSSSLRDAITRSRTAVIAVAAAVTVSPRLQLRALELSVGVSLNRLPSSKPSSTSSSSGDDDGPPVSNSLMAAIKRSQANQRRRPDTFHLMQIHNHQSPQFNGKSFLDTSLEDPPTDKYSYLLADSTLL
ncbi:hypothetical protein PIB30_053921 [Stylosanthes scabra]|uniref:Clp R domain-containing protein n=1 Tax=Stylosanthes scabra TaxID=79078 RepID=A0ABU6QI49_9FABA|nr:hypothetical protein [Stylosanthes scabra]